MRKMGVIIARLAIVRHCCADATKSVTPGHRSVLPGRERGAGAVRALPDQWREPRGRARLPNNFNRRASAPVHQRPGPLLLWRAST
jgi:hypothetical protein